LALLCVGFPNLGGGFAQVVEVVGETRAGRVWHAAAGEQLAAAGLAAPIAQGRIGAQQLHLQHRIHHQLTQRFAADLHHALLVVVGAGYQVDLVLVIDSDGTISTPK
jgi:hypothetical protein